MTDGYQKLSDSEGDSDSLFSLKGKQRPTQAGNLTTKQGESSNQQGPHFNDEHDSFFDSAKDRMRLALYKTRRRMEYLIIDIKHGKDLEDDESKLNRRRARKDPFDNSDIMRVNLMAKYTQRRSGQVGGTGHDSSNAGDDWQGWIVARYFLGRLSLKVPDKKMRYAADPTFTDKEVASLMEELHLIEYSLAQYCKMEAGTRMEEIYTIVNDLYVVRKLLSLVNKHRATDAAYFEITAPLLALSVFADTPLGIQVEDMYSRHEAEEATSK